MEIVHYPNPACFIQRKCNYLTHPYVTVRCTVVRGGRCNVLTPPATPSLIREQLLAFVQYNKKNVQIVALQS